MYWHAQTHSQNCTRKTRDAMHAMVFEQQIFFIGLGLPHIDDTCGLILGFFPRFFSWGAVLPLRWISMEWTRSHLNFPRYLTWRHDMIRTVSSNHLINAEGSSTCKSVKVHACPGHWSKSSYSVGSLLWTSCFYFELWFFWSSMLFCNVGEMKWSFGMKNIQR